MQKTKRPWLTIFFLIIIAAVTFMVDSTGLLKGQVLQAPEVLSSIKLVPQKTNPVQFDIYYDEQKYGQPQDFSIVIINSVVNRDGAFANEHIVAKSVLLNSGESAIQNEGNIQTIRIRNLQRQNSTKVGTIISRIGLSEFLSLEYDIVEPNRTPARETFIINPLPVDFPVGYHAIQNPMGSQLYVTTPGYHTLVAPLEWAITRTADLRMGALLLEDSITRLDQIEKISQGNFQIEPAHRDVPIVTVEQQQLIVPPIPEENLNTLIIRYRRDGNEWNYSSFLLSASPDVSLPIPVGDVLDFYDEVEYAFAYLSDGLPTLNLSFPGSSLMSEGAVYYETDFVSLLPELYRDRQSLKFVLQVSTAPQPDSIYIGFLNRDPLYKLSDVVQILQQKVPLLIFDEDSQTFNTTVTTPEQLPTFHLIGKNDQIWQRETTEQQLDMVSTNFLPIPLQQTSDELPELQLVNQVLGDQLLCFVKTEQGDFSLPIINEDVVTSAACLQSAYRAGHRSGTIYPVVYRHKKKELEALKHYDFDESLPGDGPVIENYNPYDNTLSVARVLDNEEVMLIVSQDPSFEVFDIAPLVAEDKRTSYSFSGLPGCDQYCYLKVVSVIRQDQGIILGHLSETLLYAPLEQPIIQLCFSNYPLIKTLYKADDLEFHLLQKEGPQIPLEYNRVSDCYEFGLDANESVIASSFGDEVEGDPPAIAVGDESEDDEPQATLRDYVYDIPELPQNTIVLETTGKRNSHIIIPPQRHYVNFSNQSEIQLVLNPLVYEHSTLLDINQGKLPEERQTSYQISTMGQESRLFSATRGNIVTGSYFLSDILTTPSINETILHPLDNLELSIPTTVRLLADEEVIIQGFREGQNIVLQLEVPERSKVRLFFEEIFRPRVQVESLISDGISFNPNSGFMELQGATGTTTIPLDISVERPTDTSQYLQTIPITPLPDDIDLAFLDSRLALRVIPPRDIPNTSLLYPSDLKRGNIGFPYESRLDLSGIEDAISYEVLLHDFLSDQCSEIFEFDPLTQTITGNIPVNTTLESCHLQVTLRYLKETSFAEMEVTADLYYRIPIQESLEDKEAITVIQVPIPVEEGLDVEQTINLHNPLEELVETTAQFSPKASDPGIITPIGDLSITFDEANQQFLFLGPSTGLHQSVSRFIRAIEQETGNLSLIELQFLPVENEEITIPLVSGFPNEIYVPQVLLDLGYTEEEVASLSLITETLPFTVEVDEANTITLFGLPELEDQMFSALITKSETTPDAFAAFESRVGETTDEQVLNTVRIDFRITITEAPTVTTEPLVLRPGKTVTLDLRQFAPNATLQVGQLPDFLTQNGNQLRGITPSQSQELTLLIQNFSDVTNIQVPIVIQEETTVREEPDTVEEPPDIVIPPVTTPSDDTLHGAATTSQNCFPDIDDQPIAYQEAICLAKEFKIVSGSGGFFRPNEGINRAEVSKILVTGPIVILGLLTENESRQLNAAFNSQSFFDTPASAWFFGFVETVRELGIVGGYPDGNFGPGNPLLRAEGAKFIVNTLQQLQPTSFSASESLASNTQPGDAWFSPFVRILNRNGGDLPEATNTAELSQPMTRAEFVYNLIILLDSKAGSIEATL